MQVEPIWINYKLIFEGRDADRNMLEAHPAGHSIEGFSWALALTLNYGVTGRTNYSRDLSQSARIFISPPKNGSVYYDLGIIIQENQFIAGLVGGYAVNTVTPYINGLISYVFNQALSVGVEFAGDAIKYIEKLKSDDLSAISRRIEPPLTRAHTAIGRTADELKLTRRGRELVRLDQQTKENMKARPADVYDSVDTNVTSFNLLTGNGRLYSPETDTTIPFSLRKSYQYGTTAALLLSMEQYDLGRAGTIRVVAERVETSNGRLVKYIVGSAGEVPQSEWFNGVDPMRQRRKR